MLIFCDLLRFDIVGEGAVQNWLQANNFTFEMYVLYKVFVS